MAESKVQFNIKNVYYAVLTETESGGVYSETFATPVALKGAVSLELSQDGGFNTFYADGIKYYIGQSNNGYTGTLEVAHIPDQMLEDIWGMTEDSTNKVLVEKTTQEAKYFALLFQVDGDANNQLFVFYKCAATRPNISAKTNEDTKEPQTQSIELTFAPLLSNGAIKSKTTEETTTTTRNSWFTAVTTVA